MTDQQTSRTNITEALRQAEVWQIGEALHRAGIGCSSNICEPTTATYIGLRRTMHDTDARDLLAALAAEPRSDAVTAPDEPSTEAGKAMIRDCTVWGIDPSLAAERVVRIEQQARAASASVPPLDYEVERCAECGGLRCPTCGQGCIDPLEAHAAETPEQD